MIVRTLEQRKAALLAELSALPDPPRCEQIIRELRAVKLAELVNVPGAVMLKDAAERGHPILADRAGMVIAVASDRAQVHYPPYNLPAIPVRLDALEIVANDENPACQRLAG